MNFKGLINRQIRFKFSSRVIRKHWGPKVKTKVLETIQTYPFQISNQAHRSFLYDQTSLQTRGYAVSLLFLFLEVLRVFQLLLGEKQKPHGHPAFSHFILTRCRTFGALIQPLSDYEYSLCQIRMDWNNARLRQGFCTCLHVLVFCIASSWF